MKHFEVKASVPALHSRTYQPRPPAVKGIRGFSYSGRQRMIFFCGDRKNIKFSSYPAWQPCLRFQENVSKELKNSALHQIVPCYLTFVRGARLWDRGVYHYTNDHPNERPPLPCARFIAHMKTLPPTLESPHLLPTKPHHSVKQQNRSKDTFSTSRNIWSSSVFSRRGQKPILQPSLFKQDVYKVPRSPAPTLASSEEDVTKSSPKSSPPLTTIMTLLTHKSGREEKEEDIKDLELLCTDPSVEDDPDLEELNNLWNHNSTVLSAIGDSHSSINSSFSNIADNQTSLSIGKGSDWSDFSKQISSRSTTDSENSTSLSQFRSSSFSISALASSSFGPGSDSSQNAYKTSQHESSPLEASCYCSSIVNLSLSNSSYHGSGDLFQASSYSVEKCSGQAPSFVEIWHDHLLHHWPVLPPISPQREFTETSYGEASQLSICSDATQTAFDELDKIMPFTGSSLSHYDQDDVSHKYFSSISEISMRAESLKLVCDDESESLTGVRLSLLDHQSWGKANQDPENNQEKEWDSPWEDGLGSRAQNKTEFTNSDIYDVLYPAYTSMKEKPNSDIYSEKGLDDQQSIYSTPNGKKSSDVFKDGSYNSTPTSVEPPSCHNLRRNSSDTELYLVREYYSPVLLSASKSKSNLHKGEDSCCVKNERAGDSGRLPRTGCGREPLKLDHSILQETEHQRKAEEKQVQALHMYSELQTMQLPGNRRLEQMSISKFEDFDFLAKYCIFSQEKLAKYKRAFEAVDSDGDGYLNCLQVLIALKEIVPSEALTDAEELYVYRILEIVDYYVTDGLTDLRLFAVMASLAQKIAALDNFMRSLIGHMDFKSLELKMYYARQLFLCNVDSQSKSITVEQLLVELKAGGVSEEHEEAVQRELRHVKTLDILDFLTYLPLFVLIHNSVISSPLDDSRTI